MTGRVVSLHKSSIHDLSKESAPSIRLLAGLGVEGDAHCGETVQHRSRAAIDPTQPNLRQVHLIHRELLTELESENFPVGPGLMGENVLTEDVDLLGLPTGTKLEFGTQATIELTGLRNPCRQLDRIDPALLARLTTRNDSGDLLRLAGVMAIVLIAGQVEIGDLIRVQLPEGPHRPLLPV